MVNAVKRKQGKELRWCKKGKEIWVRKGLLTNVLISWSDQTLNLQYWTLFRAVIIFFPYVSYPSSGLLFNS